MYERRSWLCPNQFLIFLNVIFSYCSTCTTLPLFADWYGNIHKVMTSKTCQIRKTNESIWWERLGIVTFSKTYVICYKYRTLTRLATKQTYFPKNARNRLRSRRVIKLHCWQKNIAVNDLHDERHDEIRF